MERNNPPTPEDEVIEGQFITRETTYLYVQKATRCFLLVKGGLANAHELDCLKPCVCNGKVLH